MTVHRPVTAVPVRTETRALQPARSQSGQSRFASLLSAATPATSNATPAAPARTQTRASQADNLGAITARMTAPTTPAAAPAPATITTAPSAPATPPPAKTTTTTPATATPALVTAPIASDHPTLDSVFGANPWQSTAYGSSGGALAPFAYNPEYFATPETAAKVAQMLGGTVVQANAMTPVSGPVQQSEANYMVRLPNGHLVNPGQTATYWTHGWSQDQIDRMLQFDRNV